MDFKDFNPIGLIKVLWNFDTFDDEIRDAYFEFYIPNKLGHHRGEQYCNRFIFLNNGIVYQDETIETTNFKFEQLGYDEETKLFKINFLDNIIFLTDNQYKKLQTILPRYDDIINNHNQF